MQRKTLILLPALALVLLMAASLSYGQSFTFTSEHPVMPATQGVSLDIYGYINNYSAPEAFTVDIDPSQIGNWDFSWCLGPSCYPSFYLLHEATIGVGTEDTVKVTFMEPDSNLQMYGTVSVSIYPTASPGEAVTIAFTAYFGELGVQPINPSFQPHEFTLTPAFPNPFNPATNFSYSMASSELVSIEVYNLMGQKVRTLFNGFQSQGTYAVTWDGFSDFGLDLPSAPYVITLNGAEFAETVKVLKLK
ncbi:T9SS type A sorting domain-containing protein [bacterium]|nr:T9SS type A sorting domain-containing protein [bacterium]MBU1650794.1 T9SS type A sorting domain-containing protein [bacterium]MBU1881035.1 T9SS type A sorting domain-containing protein [bacterium]